MSYSRSSSMETLPDFPNSPSLNDVIYEAEEADTNNPHINPRENRNVSSPNSKDVHETVPEKWSNTLEDRKRKLIDERKIPGNSKYQPPLFPHADTNISSYQWNEFYESDKRYSRQNTRSPGNADAAKPRQKFALTGSMPVKEQRAFQVDDSQPCCSKTVITSEAGSNTVARNKRKLSSSSFSDSSSSLTIPSRPNKVKIEEKSRNESDANLSRKEEESEKQTNSPKKNSEVKNLKAQKNESFKNARLVQFDKLIKIVLFDNHLKSLLSGQQLEAISKYKKMDSVKKYVLLMFYASSNHWCNIYTFCTKVGFEADDKEIYEMFNYLRKEGLMDFVEYTNLEYNLKDLLHPLSASQLKTVMTKILLKNKPNERVRISNRLTMIVEKVGSEMALKKLAMKAIQKVLGNAARLSQSMYNALHHLYILTTFTNPELSCINKYFKYVIDENGVFPQAPIEKYIIFKTRTQFSEYVAALEMQLKLKNETNNTEIIIIAEKAYQKLLANQQRSVHQSLPHTEPFTSNHIYCLILSKCCTSLFEIGNDESNNLIKWLKFLSDNFGRSRQLGMWMSQIITIHKNQRNMKHAVFVLFEALFKRQNCLYKEKDLHELGRLGRLLAIHSKNHGEANIHSRIIQLIPKTIDTSGCSTSYVDLPDGRSGFEIQQATLSHYFKEGYSNHEKAGLFLQALLVIYFWDIIYDPKKVISAAFISKHQFAPLDMYTFDFAAKCSRFYSQRKEVIDRRIRQIEVEWPEETFLNFGNVNYHKHSHELSVVGEIQKIIKNFNTIQPLVSILGRPILAKIFQRLITDLDQYKEGIPEFLFWNTNEKTHKFVVNTTRYSLAQLPLAESLWLRYLVRNNANIEVCFVRGGGTKKKLKGQSSDATGNEIT